jgi:hypothetical protein
MLGGGKFTSPEYGRVWRSRERVVRKYYKEIFDILKIID